MTHVYDVPMYSDRQLRDAVAKARAEEHERIRQAALDHWKSKKVSVDPGYLPGWFADLMRTGEML